MIATTWHARIAGAALLGAACLASGAGPDSPFEPATRDRRPLALASSPDGKWLFAANGRSGTLSIVDAGAARVAAEVDVGRGLSDVALLPDGRHLVAVDRSGDALVVLAIRDGSAEVEGRLPVAPDPVSVLVAPDGASCVVASTASRRLSVVALEGVPIAPRVVRSVALPFEPRALAWAVPGSKLVAADAFGGRIAVVDPARDAPESVRSLPAHNIRGLALSPDGRTIAVAHQTLHRLARSSFEDVHWGSLLGNHVRTLRVEAVLAPGSDADLLKGDRVLDLGRTGRAAGDPGAIAFDRSGKLAVALTGVDELGLVAASSTQLRRIGVGRAPSAVLAGRDGGRVYVADMLDDAISIVEVAAGKKVGSIALGPRPGPDAIGRGERLFSDARLSHDGWMSCQSCHTDGRSNGLAVDTLGDASFGAPKRVTSLLGVGATGPWTWIGTVDRLEDQVRKSIETTMRGRTPSADQVADLTAYLRSLPPPSPGPDRPDDAAARGREAFRSRKCADCHAPPEYTEPGRFDVGLADEVGNRKFNPPSLRGVGRREPLLHDGRAGSLPDVFLRHRHPRDADWTPAEVDDLVAFLRTL